MKETCSSNNNDNNNNNNNETVNTDVLNTVRYKYNENQLQSKHFYTAQLLSNLVAMVIFYKMIDKCVCMCVTASLYF